MKLDDVCPWIILLIGLLTCLGVRRKLRWAVLPLGGLFCMAADSELFWMRFIVTELLARVGYLEAWSDSQTWLVAWHVGWTLLPLALVALFAWGIWTEVRKLPLQTMVESASPTPRDT